MLRLAAEEKRGPEKRELGKRDGAGLRAATMGGGQQAHAIVAVQSSGTGSISTPVSRSASRSRNLCSPASRGRAPGGPTEDSAS
jgi:hypothetical protein